MINHFSAGAIANFAASERSHRSGCKFLRGLGRRHDTTVRCLPRRRIEEFSSHQGAAKPATTPHNLRDAPGSRDLDKGEGVAEARGFTLDLVKEIAKKDVVSWR